MQQIKLTKDATLISLCSLNYSSLLALNQPASYQRAFLTPLHSCSPAPWDSLIVLWDLSKYLFNIFAITIQQIDPPEKGAFAVLWKCPDFPLTEIAPGSVIVVMRVYVLCVRKRDGEKICLHDCVTARTRLLCEFMKHAGCRQPRLRLLHRRPVLWHVAHGEINMTLPPPPTPLKLNYWYSATKSS